MPLYVDACALAKRYLPEGRSSQTVKTMLGRSNSWGGLFVSTFTEPEVVSALARYLRERPTEEQKRHAAAQHRRTVDLFRQEFASSAFSKADANEHIFRSATVLLRDNPQWNIGAGDALHLATAMYVRLTVLSPRTPLVFVTADRGLAGAAQAKQFSVFNPDWQPLQVLEALAGAPPSST